MNEKSVVIPMLIGYVSSFSNTTIRTWDYKTHTSDSIGLVSLSVVSAVLSIRF